MNDFRSSLVTAAFLKLFGKGVSYRGLIRVGRIKYNVVGQ